MSEASEANYNWTRWCIIIASILIGLAVIFALAQSIISIYILCIVGIAILAGWIAFFIERKNEKKRLGKERKDKEAKNEACCGKAA
ncbi:MAG: hypothetical protein PHH26_09400 [Candidatus Thermoplasmatota archaeon]|nr:hypothetical protein [Candidatus Thermoplasmatota archaeon]